MLCEKTLSPTRRSAVVERCGAFCVAFGEIDNFGFLTFLIFSLLLLSIQLGPKCLSPKMGPELTIYDCSRANTKHLSFDVEIFSALK